MSKTARGGGQHAVVRAGVTLAAIVVFLGLLWLDSQQESPSTTVLSVPAPPEAVLPGAGALEQAFRNHQRFIVRLASGQTVLIAHNIDLAPRVAGLTVGATVRFQGEYEWNDRGGLVHWTHHDPEGRRSAGWIEYRGTRYQ